MKIDVRDFPETGLELAGEAPLSDYDLPPDTFLDGTGVSYAFRVDRTGDEYLVTGRFSLELKISCARCLEPLPWTVAIDPFVVSFEALGIEAIDLTPRIREDTLLALPIAPSCTLDAEERCPVTGASHRSGPDTFSELHRTEVWEALKNIKKKK
jgi:uncharacterized metal-binding protein YceD (DUF177 family)